MKGECTFGKDARAVTRRREKIKKRQDLETASSSSMGKASDG